MSAAGRQRAGGVACRLAGLLAIAAQGSVARAEGSAQATGAATASVITLVRATPLADLAFGAIVVGADEGGAVVVTPQGVTAHYSGSLRPACSGGTGCAAHPARFAISGEAGFTYRVTLPVQVVATGQRSGRQIAVTDLLFASHNQAAGGAIRLDAAGADVVTVGGTLAVAAGTPADSYAADLPISVTYD